MGVSRIWWAALVAGSTLLAGCMMAPHVATMSGAFPSPGEPRARPAPEPARDRRGSEAASPGAPPGETVALQTAPGQGFAGVLTQVRNSTGALVLVHGADAATAPGLAGALRGQLAERGYTVLAIPILAPAAGADASARAATYPQSGERISAALDFLRSRGSARVALVSHSLGSLAAEDWVRRNPQARFAAWIPLAIPGGRFERLGVPAFPVFDIYAERDTEAVLRGARQRAAVLRSIRGSRQAMLFGAGPDFAHKEKELAALIESLLDPLMK